MEIHPPFRRIHKVMHVITLGLVAALLVAVVALALSPSRDRYWNDYVLGVSAIAGLIVIAAGTYWGVYLVIQRSVRVGPSDLTVRSWLRPWGLGQQINVPIDAIEQVTMIRPHHLELRTREQALRVGTFWWRKSDYEALQAALQQRGVKVEYSERTGFGLILSSW